MHKYNVGDVIEYMAFGNERRQVIVEYKDSDIKNGRPGFDGSMLHNPDAKVWGYDAQITRVVDRRSLGAYFYNGRLRTE